MRVLTFARVYPGYHPRSGQPTRFVEKILRGIHQISDEAKQIIDMDIWATCTPKLHTIRAGHRWKAGDMFSPRVWSGKPYRSKQIEFAPGMEVKRVYDFAILDDEWWLNKRLVSPDLLQTIATNDGLSLDDFISWFKWPKEFTGQVIIWDEKLKY